MLDTRADLERQCVDLLDLIRETRARTGELLPFKKGAALLALRSGFPLLPVGVAGTGRALPRGSFQITAGRVALSIGEPIAVANRSARERDELTREAREAIEQLRDEAAAALEVAADG